MRVLVTGASGFLGRALCEKLKEEGFYVIATDLKKDHDICDEFILADLSKDSLSFPKVDVVFHLAGLFDLSQPPSVLFRANVVSTLRLLQYYIGKTGKVIHVSSTGVYGVPRKTPCDEDVSPHPRNWYEKTKYIGEECALLFSKFFEVTVARPTLIYGPGSRYGHAMLIGLFSLLKARGREEIPLVKGGHMTHSAHVYDVASALLVLLNGKNGERYNIADDSPCPFELFLLSIITPLGLKPSFRIPAKVGKYFSILFSYLPIYDQLREKVLSVWDKVLEERRISSPLRPQLVREWRDYSVGDFFYSTKKIKSLGFRPKYDIFTGMEQTISWYKSHGWIP